MKRMNKTVVSIMLCLVMILGLAGCGKKEADVWSDAKYTEDAKFGDGSKQLTVIVEAMDKKVTFEIATDAATVGEALVEHGLLEGEEGPYGLFIKAVNGMQADYDEDQAYWGFFQDGEYMMTGVDLTEFEDGAQYELVYTTE